MRTICTKAADPSCMRVPPEAVAASSGRPSEVARRIDRSSRLASATADQAFAFDTMLRWALHSGPCYGCQVNKRSLGERSGSVPCFVYAAARSPFGRIGGALSGVRPDDLAAAVISSLLAGVPEL